ncbi:hypothetical protein GCM10027599_09530 [Yimella radicis]
MTRLIKAEFRRAFARGITKGVLLLALLFAGFTIFAMYQQVSNMPTQVELQQSFRFAHDDWAKNHQRYEKDCLASTPESERNNAPTDFCDFPEPELSDFVGQNGTLGGVLKQGTSGLLMVAALAALVLGASLVCAEFASGSMMTWLTFEPQRIPVYASKVLVATLMGLLPVLVLVAIAGPGFWLAGSSGELEFAAGEQSTYLATLGRLFGVGMFCSLVGTALGFVLRHTTAVLGFAAVWVIAVELIGGNSIADARRWTIGTALSAFVDHGKKWETYPPCYSGGADCRPVIHWLGFWPATSYLLVVAVVGFLIGLVTFRRRDVG